MVRVSVRARVRASVSVSVGVRARVSREGGHACVPDARLAEAKDAQRRHGAPRQGGGERGGADGPKLRVAQAEPRERGQAAAAQALRELADALVAVAAVLDHDERAELAQAAPRREVAERAPVARRERPAVEVAEQQLLRVAQIHAAPRPPARPHVECGQPPRGLVLRPQLEKLRLHWRVEASGYAAQLDHQVRAQRVAERVHEHAQLVVAQLQQRARRRRLRRLLHRHMRLLSRRVRLRLRRRRRRRPGRHHPRPQAVGLQPRRLRPVRDGG